MAPRAALVPKLMFDRFDENSDGQLSKTEFVADGSAHAEDGSWRATTTRATGRPQRLRPWRSAARRFSPRAGAGRRSRWPAT